MTADSLYARGARRKGGAAKWYAFRVTASGAIDAANQIADVFVLAFSKPQAWSIAETWRRNGGDDV